MITGNVGSVPDLQLKLMEGGLVCFDLLGACLAFHSLPHLTKSACPKIGTRMSCEKETGRLSRCLMKLEEGTKICFPEVFWIWPDAVPVFQRGILLVWYTSHLRAKSCLGSWTKMFKGLFELLILPVRWRPLKTFSASFQICGKSFEACLGG